ncbi:MAG: methyltransferase domain-containing protein [Promethearchaeia archaeon]
MNKLDYIIWATYRRRMLDYLQEKFKFLYKGVVLDIGGRDRGIFKKPRDKVDQWIFADINKNHNPDIILDVSDMKQIESESIDVINAIELFEHVEGIDKALKECNRVLKKGGIFIISVPFLWQIHADPYDFQRWTEDKWRIELKKNNFKILHFIIMGYYYTHLAEIIKFRINSKSIINRIILLFILPILNKLMMRDKKIKNKELKSFHNGYFIIAEKINNI